MIAPTRRTLWISVALIALALAPAFATRQLWAAWLAALMLLVVACLADLLFALPTRKLELAIEQPEMMYIGEHGVLSVSLRARAKLPWLELACDLGPTLAPQPTRTVPSAVLPLSVNLELWPNARGRAELIAVWARWPGPLGLFSRARRFPLDSHVAVVPNTRLVRNAALRFHAREARYGSKIERYAGEGSEFDALRDHAAGMDPRALHWKASARHRKLVSREFRAERNHQIVLCFDAGRLMVEPVAGLSRLDHAIHAALLLTYFSLRGGDRVGLYSYDVQPRTFASPEGGSGAFARLLRATAEVNPRLEESNHTRGLIELAQRLRRRSLIVIFTEFVDSIAAALLVEGLERLARRHLVLFVTLGDEELVATRAAPPRALDQLYRAVVAGELLRDRRVVLQRLRRAGVQCVDAPPLAVSSKLLNRYLDIRRREMV